MAKKNTRGFYLFEDGYYCWVSGMSAEEKRREIKTHGRIIRFTPTNQKGDKNDLRLLIRRYGNGRRVFR